ncbi:MAG: hypothetical protein JSR75_15475 [Proteobacteria bacterium]|nr:hypothetical protein [Pseudomonadota bacterium]MBS0473526.1 hypothetical protein [Pseudomonadota bacterium]
MPTHAADAIGEPSRESAQQTVYVVMSENADGVAGMVCATRQRAEDELRSILGEYMTYDVAGARPRHSFDAIEAMIEVARGATINPFRDDWYWIDVCPVHT